MLFDPLEGLSFDIQAFDLPREASVYPDKAGLHWWTKSWFNKSEKGELAVEIELWQAVMFLRNEVELDEWLEEFYPEQMDAYHTAIKATCEQLLKQKMSMNT